MYTYNQDSNDTLAIKLKYVLDAGLTCVYPDYGQFVN